MSGSQVDPIDLTEQGLSVYDPIDVSQSDEEVGDIDEDFDLFEDDLLIYHFLNGVAGVWLRVAGRLVRQY